MGRGGCKRPHTARVLSIRAMLWEAKSAGVNPAGWRFFLIYYLFCLPPASLPTDNQKNGANFTPEEVRPCANRATPMSR